MVYQSYVERLLIQVGWSDPGENATRIVAMETLIAKAHWPREETRDLEKTYNPLTLAELEVLAPGFPWQAFFTAAKLPSITRVIIAEKSAFPKIAEIFATTPIAVLQAWEAYKVLSRAAPYLSKPFSDAHFEMYEKTILGQEKQRARWKRGVFAVSGDLDGNSDPLGNLGWAVGQLYGEQYFTSPLRSQVETLVNNIVNAFRARLKKNDWMTAATKAEALEKLDSFIIQVGYPSKPQRDYSSLLVSDGDLVGDVQRVASLDWNFFVNRLPNPVDRNEWFFTPQANNAVNAFYLRSITFPAALLQAPMYDSKADDAVNYGAFGAYAGHEITHGFDDQGRKIDSKGRLRDWWSVDEAKTFVARAAELGNQYSAFEPLVGSHVNGQLTMGENIADLGGLTLALDAYHASLQGKPAPIIDGLTGDQRVFLGWAQAWRGKLSESALRDQVTRDPDSPRQYRVNGVVRNINEWYEAFGVKPDGKLYLRPENRVHIGKWG